MELAERGLLRDRGRRPRDRPATPRPATRILDGGTVTLVVSLGKERYDVPDVRGRSEDQAQDALDKHNLGLRRVHREVLREGARGRRHRQRPEGRHHPAPGLDRRPDRQQGAAPDPGPRLGRQERRPRRDGDGAQGPRGRPRPVAYDDDDPRGLRHLPVALQRHPLPRRDPHPGRLAGTRAGRRPRRPGRLRRRGRPPAAARRRASTSTSSAPTATSASATSTASTRRPGRWCPRAARSPSPSSERSTRREGSTTGRRSRVSA